MPFWPICILAWICSCWLLLLCLCLILRLLRGLPQLCLSTLSSWLGFCRDSGFTSPFYLPLNGLSPRFAPCAFVRSRRGASILLALCIGPSRLADALPLPWALMTLLRRAGFLVLALGYCCFIVSGLLAPGGAAGPSPTLRRPLSCLRPIMFLARSRVVGVGSECRVSTLCVGSQSGFLYGCPRGFLLFSGVSLSASPSVPQ